MATLGWTNVNSNNSHVANLPHVWLFYEGLASATVLLRFCFSLTNKMRSRVRTQLLAANAYR
jgi:hypothetical protein